MTNRKFDMFQYRQVLVRIRRGDLDRAISRSKAMGRKKIAQVRELAMPQGWLAMDLPMPDEHAMAALLGRKESRPVSCISTLEPWRTAGIQGTSIHSILTRNHGFTGSYSSVYRFLIRLGAQQVPDVSLRLGFAANEGIQVDFGAGPLMTDTLTGEIFKTWFFVMTLR